MASQAVRDLLWVVNSPSFVRGSAVASPAVLQAEQIDPDALQRFLGEDPPHRVGRYFEQLVHYWLVHVRGVELLGAGLQIRNGKRTIGELDFVYRDEDGVVVHCEVAVKFFLHHPRHGHSDFPGPNASDNFELKTNKLFEQQLELSREHFPAVERRQAFVKGMVFYRSRRPDELPERMSPNHASGKWIYADDLDQLQQHAAAGGIIVTKPHWLAPLAGAAITDMLSLVADLRTHFAGDRGHPVMISLSDGSTTEEIERMFVVPQHWPELEAECLLGTVEK